MTTGGIDHLVILVRDLGAGRHRFDRLGFTLTARAEHSAAMGTANTCLMFGHDYVELLTVVRPTDANAPWRRRLAHGDGLSVVALATKDADDTWQTLRAAGIEADPPLRFSRDVQTPTGVRTAAFSITRLPPSATPTIPMFACQHHTPELVWRPETQIHENGALGLNSVWAVSDRPRDQLPAYRKVFGADRVTLGDDRSLVVNSGATPIRLVTPAQYVARFPGADLPKTPEISGLAAFSVRVRDLAEVQRLLTARGITGHGSNGPDGTSRLWVGPQDGCGAVVEFVPAR